jgi:hypothetical protein
VDGVTLADIMNNTSDREKVCSDEQ